MSIGAFTAPEVMLTTRPKPRSAISSTVAFISSIGVSMLASSALIQASRSQSRKSPGGGPPALLTRMSTCGQAASAAARPGLGRDVAGDGAHLAAGRARAARRAVASSASAPRAVIDDVDALRRQRHRAALAEPLARGADQRPLAFDPEIHVAITSTWPATRCRPAPAPCRRRSSAVNGSPRITHAHQDRRQRPDHAGLRRHRGADALDRHHHHQHRREGAQRRVEHRQPDHLGRDRQRRRAAAAARNWAMHSRQATLVARPVRRSAPSRFTSSPLRPGRPHSSARWRTPAPAPSAAFAPWNETSWPNTSSTPQ